MTILEQSDRVGGKAGTFERDGFVFDTGPSLLTLPAVYRDLFLKTGTSLEDNVDLQRWSRHRTHVGGWQPRDSAGSQSQQLPRQRSATHSADRPAMTGWPSSPGRPTSGE